MRVLLDEQLPVDLAKNLAEHDVRSVKDEDWKGLSNGELLARAEDAGFQVFVTSDRNLQHQQDLSRTTLGVVVLMAPTNKLEDLRPLIPRALEAMTRISSGKAIRIEPEVDL